MELFSDDGENSLVGDSICHFALNRIDSRESSYDWGVEVDKATDSLIEFGADRDRTLSVKARDPTSYCAR